MRASKAYKLLAVHAAHEAGVKLPARASRDDWLKAAAENDAACELRGRLWDAYEARLRDARTYELDDIAAWLAEKSIRVARSSIHRDRQAMARELERFRWAATKARATIDAATEAGESDLLRAGRLAAGQLLFDALMDLTPQSLAALDAKQILRLIEVQAKLSTAHAQSDLLGEKLAEMRRKFDEQVAAAKRKAAAKGAAGGDAFDDEMIQQIRRAVFGEAA